MFSAITTSQVIGQLPKAYITSLGKLNFRKINNSSAVAAHLTEFGRERRLKCIKIQTIKKEALWASFFILEREKRLELSTYTLARYRSTN
jgi:hypothetical protein